MSFPFQQLHFDEHGQLLNITPAAFTKWAADQKLTDLFIFSHGWNNDPAMAMSLYNGFFGAMESALAGSALKRNAVIGTAGVIWPSIKWPDDDGNTSTGGAASFHAEAPMDLFEELKKVFLLPAQQATLDRLRPLLESQPASDAALREFKQGLTELLAPTSDAAPHDSLEKSGIVLAEDSYREMFDALADQEPAPDSLGGAAGIDIFGRLWQGAKAALRVTTYYQMKDRAATVGEVGLGPLLGLPNVRVYLLGHSFGARLVSHALKTAPPGAVKMLYLLQGAFSHFAFAKKLPFDFSRGGDLAGMDTRVDGPLITTHSLFDLAVGSAYPLASFVARQDASAATDADYRWGAMGHDGAQIVGAQSLPLNAPRNQFSFKPGMWLNLDGNQVIKTGGLPSGAHSDIIHPETAWVALAGAGLV
jgi:hypothetical protein